MTFLGALPTMGALYILLPVVSREYTGRGDLDTLLDMGKESLKGHGFYVHKGLKRLTIYVPKGAYKKLFAYAKKDSRSFHYVLQKILVDFSKRI